MRLSIPFLLLILGLAAPAARAGDTRIASDLNAAFTVATLDNAEALGLEPGRRFGARHGTAAFWIGAEYRSLLRNKMVGFFIGSGAATGAYNG